jgi:uncharacterized protein YbjT (DUF2867 family)
MGLHALIVLDGATGNLGARIARRLVEQQAHVRALVRPADHGRSPVAPWTTAKDVLSAHLKT